MKEREQWRVRDGVVMTAKGEAERTVGVEGGTGDKLGMESWAWKAGPHRHRDRGLSLGTVCHSEGGQGWTDTPEPVNTQTVNASGPGPTLPSHLPHR